VGFFLEQHKNALMVEDVQLEPLRRLRPRQPIYFVRRKREFLDLLLEKGEIDTGKWHEIEFYIYRHSDAKFSYGICRECIEPHYAGYNLSDD
jgi:hypothetical protein